MTEFYIRAFVNSFLGLWFFAIVKFRENSTSKVRHFRSLFFACFFYILTYFILHSGLKAPAFEENTTAYLIGFLVVIVVGWFVFYFIEWVRANLDQGPPYFKLFGGLKLIPFDRRVALIFSVWIFTLLVTSGMLTVHDAKPSLMDNGFVTSWLGDVLFFSLVGIAVALAGIRLPHTEAFDTRLSILFSGNKSEAMQSTRDRVKALGFYVSLLEWDAVIKEYSDDHDAVRFEVDVTYTLENMFGDVDAVDRVAFEIIPDEWEENAPDPLGYIEAMRVDADDLSIRRLPAPILIEQGGVSVDERFTVKDEPVKIRYRYWLWAKVGAPWSHKPNRFTESVQITVTNTIQPENIAVDIEKLNAPDGVEAISTIRYGERCEIPEERSLEWGSSYMLFKILLPREIEADCS